MKIKVEDFNLRHTLEAGQCFEWEEYKKGYAAVLGDIFIYVYQVDNILNIIPRKEGKIITEENSPTLSKKIIKDIKHYFGLDINYNQILKEINKDENIDKAIRKYQGIRLAKQPHFECFISFMLSANNTVQNIKNARKNISKKYGHEIYFDKESNKKFYSFPSIEELKQASEKDLRECKTGFRARYIHEALQQIDNSYFSGIEKKKYRYAKESLMKFKGIGEKIADCILLYSFDFDNIYPTDTWVKKFTKELYLGSKANEKEIREFGTKYFNGYAGWAQLFFYIYFRENKEI